MLEAAKHATSSFITLTYDDEHLPADRSLSPRDFRLWMYSFRKACRPARIRFYGVGEYGEQSGRPHYHVAVFGGPPAFSRELEDICRRTWKKGFVQVGDLTKDSAQYICGYVTKGLTKKTDPRLAGRYPEFARMSNRPGIGATAVEDIVSVLTSEHGVKVLESEGDVPRSLRLGMKNLPLGKYLRRKLREKIASPEGVQRIKEESTLRWSLQMQELLKGDGGKKARAERRQKILNLESRVSVFKQRKDKL